MPNMYMCVAAPILKECVLNVFVSIPKNVSVLCNMLENWYEDRGLPLKWQNKGPSSLDLHCRKVSKISKHTNDSDDLFILIIKPLPH